MPSIQVNNVGFGQMSNQIPKQFYLLDQYIVRLEAAVAQAASGFNGTAGTEFENTEFGVVASSTPGAQGTAWRSAVDGLSSAWNTFKSSAIGQINALDNGP